MSNQLGDILVQAGYYGITMILSLGFAGLILKGFFWKFIRVKLSFGKLVMVKVRAVNRDYFRVGKVEDNMLVFKSGGKKGGDKRVDVKDNSVFYRSIGISWVDVDDELNIILKPNNEFVSGFDAVKYNNLYVRALTKPSIDDKRDKILIGGIILIIVVVGFVGFLVYRQSVDIQAISQAIGSLNNAIGSLDKGVLVAGG